MEKAFPLETVLRWASEITGKPAKSDRNRLVDIIRESLESLHNEESLENLRKWCVYSCGCLITMPKELGIPYKYKVGNAVGPVRQKPYEFLGYARDDSLDPGYRQDLAYAGTASTFFDLPAQGGRVAARALERFTSGSPYLVVQGDDIYGNEVFTPNAEGKLDVGEIVPVSTVDQAPSYSKTIFRRIKSVRIVNSQLNIQFVWCNAKNYGDIPYELGLLSFYDPGEEYPSFSRYALPVETNDCLTVEVLGQLKQPALLYDNELIRGFDSGAIKNMIRANYFKDKNDIQGAQFNASLAVSSIRKKNEKVNTNGDLIAVDPALSAKSFPEVY